MNKKEVLPGIKYIEGKYVVDYIKVINRRRIHVYKKGLDSLEDAKVALDTLIKKKLDELSNVGLVKISLNDFLDKYFIDRGKRVSFNCLGYEKSMFNRWLKGCLEKLTYVTLSYDNIEYIYKDILSKDISTISKNRLICILIRLVNKAHEWKYISEELYINLSNLLIKIPNKKYNLSKDRISKEEVELFFSKIDDSTFLLIFKLMYELILDVEEVISLKWNNFNVSRKTLEIRSKVKYIGNRNYEEIKLNKIKEIPLSISLYKLLKQRKMKVYSKGYIFSSPFDAEMPISIRTIKNKMHKYANLCNIKHFRINSLNYVRRQEAIEECINDHLLMSWSERFNCSKAELLRKFAFEVSTYEKTRC